MRDETRGQSAGQVPGRARSGAGTPDGRSAGCTLSVWTGEGLQVGSGLWCRGGAIMDKFEFYRERCVHAPCTLRRS
jgi:hypothetical protein